METKKDENPEEESNGVVKKWDEDPSDIINFSPDSGVEIGSFPDPYVG